MVFNHVSLSSHSPRCHKYSNNNSLSTSQQHRYAETLHWTVVREMAELEGSLKAVENEMRDMTRSSAVRNGRVDPSFLRKKKAVDRRFELLLRNISEKREVITTTEQKLYVYDEKKEEKESQLKSLETDLVSLLVQQQKRMLSILNTDNDDE